MGPIPMSGLDTAAVRAACTRRLRVVEPTSLPAFAALLDRLGPDRWTLEWHLPWWLGHTLGIAPDIAFELVVSDVLGLASIRLEDDLADGQVPTDDLERSSCLAGALLEEALRSYRAWFEPGHAMWARVEAAMALWRTAAGTGDGAVDGAQARRRLAARAAPLRIPVFAVCSLAGREDAVATLDEVLDHALAGLVLADHLADWEDDLDGGRWNALVASVSDRAQTSEHREAHRAGVRVALMADGAAAAFGRRIGSELGRAADLSEAFDCAPLTAYLRAEAAGAVRQAGDVDAHYRGVADRATELLFGDRNARGATSLPGSPTGTQPLEQTTER